MPLGIPHSEFKGWLPSDQDKAIAHILREAERCSSCAQFPEDWLDAKGRVIYHAEAVAHVCEACRELDSVKRAVPDKIDTTGWTWRWKRRTPGPGRQ